MCNAACIEFVRAAVRREDVQHKRVIEVGSLNVNGSAREVIEPMSPGVYIGVDIQNGPGVDELCDIGGVIERFGRESFDAVVSTELLEHVRDWRGAVSSLKNLLRPNGVLLITTRSEGFAYHGYPADFWRYDVQDMKAIFSDMAIEAIEEDPLAPGIFIKVRKPAVFTEDGLASHKLYSVISGKRRRDVSGFEVFAFRFSRRLLFSRIGKIIWKTP